MSHWRAVLKQQHEKESRNCGTAAKTEHFVTDSRWAVETEQTSETKKINEFVTAMKPSKRYSKEEKKHGIDFSFFSSPSTLGYHTQSRSRSILGIGKSANETLAALDERLRQADDTHSD